MDFRRMYTHCVGVLVLVIEMKLITDVKDRMKYFRQLTMLIIFTTTRFIAAPTPVPNDDDGCVIADRANSA